MEARVRTLIPPLAPQNQLFRVRSAPPLRPQEARLVREAQDDEVSSMNGECGHPSPRPVPLRPVQTYDPSMMRTIY